MDEAPALDAALSRVETALLLALQGSCSCSSSSSSPDQHNPDCLSRPILLAMSAVFEAQTAILGARFALAGKNFLLCPEDPDVMAVSAWWRIKNGFHFHDDPQPEDCSDMAAYRALTRAAAGFATYGQPGHRPDLHRDEDMLSPGSRRN